jgi:hypothetical protein
MHGGIRSRLTSVPAAAAVKQSQTAVVAWSAFPSETLAAGPELAPLSRCIGTSRRLAKSPARRGIQGAETSRQRGRDCGSRSWRGAGTRRHRVSVSLCVYHAHLATATLLDARPRLRTPSAAGDQCLKIVVSTIRVRASPLGTASTSRSPAFWAGLIEVPRRPAGWATSPTVFLDPRPRCGSQSQVRLGLRTPDHLIAS